MVVVDNVAQDLRFREILAAEKHSVSPGSMLGLAGQASVRLSVALQRLKTQYCFGAGRTRENFHAREIVSRLPGFSLQEPMCGVKPARASSSPSFLECPVDLYPLSGCLSSTRGAIGHFADRDGIKCTAGDCPSQPGGSNTFSLRSERWTDTDSLMSNMPHVISCPANAMNCHMAAHGASEREK